MKPLLFLTSRTIINGFKRALTHPSRLIGLLVASFGLLRYVFIPFRGERIQDFHIPGLDRANHLVSHIDAVRILDAIVFALFALMTFFLAIGVLNARGGFRPADVDVLFPTPIEPKLVLVFRIVRDYLLTLLTPLFFIIVGFRPASAGIKSLQQAFSHPESIAMTLRYATATWLLVALCWVCINYAVSLFINRSDLASDRNKRIISWSVLALAAGVVGFISWELASSTTWQEAVTLSESPILRIVFFTSTLATWMIHGIVQGDPTLILAGFGGLVLIIAVSIRIAMTQASWMYDQAAVRGFDTVNTRKLQQQGDTIALITEQARRGKIKARRSRWISKINAPGAWAILWKESIITVRSSLAVVILLGLMSLSISIIPAIAGMNEMRQTSVGGYVFMAFQAFGVFVCSSALSQAGFIEMLRRVDVQKPLPFSFSTTVLFEVLAKSLPGTLTAWLGAVVVTVMQPVLWQYAVASIIAMPFIAVLVCSMTCLVTIVFPDFDDPSQRSFRGLINLVGITMSCGPGVLLFAGGVALGFSPILAALAVCILNAGVATIVTSLAGNQYAQFNPSE